MNAAKCIVRALLDSNEDLLGELGEIASNPAKVVMLALERGEALKKTYPGLHDYTCDVEIEVRPSIGSWSKTRMILIRWTHHNPLLASDLRKGTSGGGYFFIRPETFDEFGKSLESFLGVASRAYASDSIIKSAYHSVAKWRFSRPRKRYARSNYTEDGVYAYD